MENHDSPNVCQFLTERRQYFRSIYYGFIYQVRLSLVRYARGKVTFGYTKTAMFIFRILACPVLLSDVLIRRKIFETEQRGEASEV